MRENGRDCKELSKKMKKQYKHVSYFYISAYWS